MVRKFSVFSVSYPVQCFRLLNTLFISILIITPSVCIWLFGKMSSAPRCLYCLPCWRTCSREGLPTPPFVQHSRFHLSYLIEAMWQAERPAEQSYSSFRDKEREGQGSRATFQCHMVSEGELGPAVKTCLRWTGDTVVTQIKMLNLWWSHLEFLILTQAEGNKEPHFGPHFSHFWQKKQASSVCLLCLTHGWVPRLKTNQLPLSKGANLLKINKFKSLLIFGVLPAH